MKLKQLLTKTLLAVAMLGVGGSAWGDEVFGTTSDTYLKEKSTSITMYDGGTLHYEFTQTTRATNNYDGFVVIAENRGGTKYIALRQDNWDNIAASNTGCTNNYDWTNFPALLNGASVDMTITYNNGTFTMTSTVTGSDHNDYSYGYTKAITGSPAAIVVYLSEEAAQITLTTSDYSNSNVVATLNHTAHVGWGSNTGASTCDVEQEYFNNDASSAWAAAAFAEYSFTIPEGHSITSAVLSWKGTSSKGYGSTLYYLNVGESFSFDPLPAAGTNQQFSGEKTLIDGSIPSLSGGVSITTDVTSAVSTVVANSQNSITFQWTGNQGGANLYGKGSTSDSPILIIKTSAETLYTATFTETNSLNPTVTIYSDEGRTASVTNGTLTNGTTYYYRATLLGYRNYEGSFTVSGADPNVEFTMTAKTQFTYNVYAVNSSSVKLQDDPIATSTVYEDETATVRWSKYIKIGGQWYVTSETSFYATATEAGSRNVVYTLSDIAYFSEMENLTRSGGSYLTEEDASYSNRSRLRLSRGSLYYTPALPAGVYTLNIGVVNSNNTSNEVYVYTRSGGGVLSDKLYTHVAEKGSSTINTVITVPEGYSIAFNGNEGGSANNNARMDYMTLNPYKETPTISADGYATYSSPYALDFEHATGVKGYYTTSAENGTVSMTKITGTAAAGEGIFLQRTTGDISIPVVATGDALTGNLLVATDGSDIEASTTGSYNYVFAKQSGNLGFYKVTSDLSGVAAGKAYLHTTSEIKGSSARLTFAFDDETTGISEELIVNSEEFATASVYDLQGRKVIAPTKGLYIVNGKKVVIK